MSAEFPGSRPARAQRRLTIKLTACGVRARCSIPSHWSMDGKSGPWRCRRARAKGAARRRAVRPAGRASSSAAAVLVRRSAILIHGRRGELGSSGSRATGASSLSCSTRRRAISLRRRPPEPKATSSSAASRQSASRFGAAGREEPIEDVAGDGAPALAAARPRAGADGEPHRGAQGGGGERTVEAAPAMQRAPTGQAPFDRRGRVRTVGAQGAGGGERGRDVGGHAVGGVDPRWAGSHR